MLQHKLHGFCLGGGGVWVIAGVKRIAAVQESVHIVERVREFEETFVEDGVEDITAIGIGHIVDSDLVVLGNNGGDHGDDSVFQAVAAVLVVVRQVVDDLVNDAGGHAVAGAFAIV